MKEAWRLGAVLLFGLAGTLTGIYAFVPDDRKTVAAAGLIFLASIAAALISICYDTPGEEGR